MSNQPMTRREARELERLHSGQVAYIPSTPTVDSSDIASPTVAEVPSATMPPAFFEPNTIVVENVPNLENLTVVLPESGAVLTTGSIELPWLKTESGQIQMVSEGETADSAVAVEFTDVSSGIVPVAARTHERSRRRRSVFPTRLRKGWGIVHLVMVSGFLLLALFSGLIAAYLLGLITL